MKNLLRKFIPKKIRNLKHLFYAWYGAFKYSHPSEELFVIGVTGTSGKSSTVFLLRQILESAGFRVGSLSTIDFYIAGENKLNDQKMTMLGKMQIQKYLREMVDKKCDIAIVETTSEGRVQYRHRFINYDIMVLTNLYPEHIESHGSFEKYKRAKLDLFGYVSKCRKKLVTRIPACRQAWRGLYADDADNADALIPKTVIVNGNSEYAEEFLDFNFEKKISFAWKDQEICLSPARKKLTLLVGDIVATEKGLNFNIANTPFHTPLFGVHNTLNINSALSVAREFQIDWDVLQKAVANLKPIPGRVEFIKEAEKCGFKVIVDYAFEPKAMSALYEVVDLLKPKRVVHVFGSTGGGRDVSRRAVLGEIIGKKANICIITDEDPYEDDPMEIITDVANRVEKTGKILDKNLFKILDRKEAIYKAIEIAEAGDLILVTGKGSEQGMCVAGGKMIGWDDREVVREVIGKLYMI